MNEPIVSVIVPVYNAEKSVEKCVLSILDNRYQALELILVNDGSSDGSGAICDKLAKIDHRIKVIHQVNGGVGAARNHGLSLASGKYVAFLDSDDTVDAEMYEKLVRAAEEHDADCVVCSLVNVYASHTETVHHVFQNQVITNRAEINERIVVPLIIPGHGDAVLMQGPCNKLYRNSLIQKHGLQFSHLPYAEDWLFNIAFLMNCDIVSFLDEPLYFYDRTSEGSLSKSWRKDSFRNTVWIQNKLAQLFPERYSSENLMLGVLGIQVECLRNYAYYCGAKGFFTYASQLFSDEELANAYRALPQLPAQYRFPKKCIVNGWRKRYGLWGLYQVKMNVVKHYLRAILR